MPFFSKKYRKISINAMSRISQDDATYRTGITNIGSAYLATNGVKVV